MCRKVAAVLTEEKKQLKSYSEAVQQLLAATIRISQSEGIKRQLKSYAETVQQIQEICAKHSPYFGMEEAFRLAVRLGTAASVKDTEAMAKALSPKPQCQHTRQMIERAKRSGIKAKRSH